MNTDTTKKAVRYAIGCSINGAKNQPDFDSAVNLARNSDIAIVVCGTDLSVADEGNDRTSLDLPGVQEELIKAVFHANPKTIVVLVTGYSLAVNWEEDSIPAIISAWYDGQAQGSAIADVLFGDYNPGGKLSTTWYKSVADLPSMNDYDIKHNRTYMYFKGTPLYPFGFGLSYSTFRYSNLKISSETLNPGDSISVSAKITNTGKFKGDEVVQLYVHVASSSVVRPIKELKAFKRISLNAGELQTVNLTLKHEDLSYYDVKSRTYKVEDGTLDIFIGSSSYDIKLDTQINVNGGTVASAWLQNPFSIIEAENFENKSSSVKLAPCSEGGQSIDSLIFNSYVVYKNFDFNTEAKQFNARLAATNSNDAVIQIRLDSLTGSLAGTLSIIPTGDLNIYSTESCELSGATGIRDVYMVFKTGATNSCRLNWFSFQKTVGETIHQQLFDNDYKLTLYPNPASSYITISYNLPVVSDVKIEFFDQEGRLVKSISQQRQNSGFQKEEMSTDELNIVQGLYIMQFSTDFYSKSLLFSIIK